MATKRPAKNSRKTKAIAASGLAMGITASLADQLGLSDALQAGSAAPSSDALIDAALENMLQQALQDQQASFESQALAEAEPALTEDNLSLGEVPEELSPEELLARAEAEALADADALAEGAIEPAPFGDDVLLAQAAGASGDAGAAAGAAGEGAAAAGAGVDAATAGNLAAEAAAAGAAGTSPALGTLALAGLGPVGAVIGAVAAAAAVADSGGDGTPEEQVTRISVGLTGLTGGAVADANTAGNPVVIAGMGTGSTDIDALNAVGSTFNQSLDVELDLGATAGPSADLGTSLAGLQNFGIDRVSGAEGQQVVISEGLGAGFDAASAPADFFASDLDVQLLLDSDVEGTIMANGLTLKDLAKLGIDSIDNKVGVVDKISIDTGLDDGLSSADLAQQLSDLIAQFDSSNPIFAAEDEVTAQLTGYTGAQLEATKGDLTGNEIDKIIALGIDYIQGSDGIWDLNA